MPWRRRATGFTLIELLAVIATLALLLALMLPVIGRAQAQGRAAQCLSNLRQWTIFWVTYAGDNEGNFSDGWILELDGSVVDWHRGEWATVLHKYYLNQTDILKCPEATARLPGKTYGGPRHAFIMGPPMTNTESSYGLNCWLYNPPPDRPTIQGRPASNHWRRLSGVTQPRITPMFLDAMWRGTGPGHGAPTIEPPAYNGEWVDYDAEMRHVAMMRHRRGIQVAFADLSARYVPIKSLWAFKWHRAYNTNNVNTVDFPDWMNE